METPPSRSRHNLRRTARVQASGVASRVGWPPTREKERRRLSRQGVPRHDDVDNGDDVVAAAETFPRAVARRGVGIHRGDGVRPGPASSRRHQNEAPGCVPEDPNRTEPTRHSTQVTAGAPRSIHEPSSMTNARPPSHLVLFPQSKTTSTGDMRRTGAPSTRSGPSSRGRASEDSTRGCPRRS